MALYDTIGVDYDATRSADPYILSRLLHHLRPCNDALYLDVGCGTGNYTVAMQDAGVSVVGMDISATMLAQARGKGRSIQWLRARAEAIPFKDGTFAGASCIFVHHHMADPLRAFKEVRRALRANARLVLFNGTVEQTRHAWLCEYFPRMMADAAAPFERYEVNRMLEAAGFKIEGLEPYSVTEDLCDWFLMCGKKSPERYLDPRVRAGISCFAASPHQQEMEQGLERLRFDIASGRIAEVIRSYDWDGGDYTFTIAS